MTPRARQSTKAIRRQITDHYRALAATANEATLRQIVAEAGQIIGGCLDYETALSFAAELPHYGIAREQLRHV